VDCNLKNNKANIDSYIMIIMSLISGDDNSIKCFGNVVKYYNLALEDIKK
jgi:hypothetical protein